MSLTDTDGAIGYADDSAVPAAETLGVASIKVGSDYNASDRRRAPPRCSRLSPAAPDQPATSMATDIDRTATAKGDYPLMLASYLLACQTYSDSKTADMVKGYLTYVVSPPRPAGRSGGRKVCAADRRSCPTKATAIVSQISAS